ncbi:MAG: LLM class flavin-dependent oxidoreductase [Rhodospirillaceae bacterium]|nr:LLM class flavin-dependent oxidoreductase [Rhodospirillaceae bacterium]
MEFGVFDHLDRGNLPLDVFYEMRLKIIELYDRSGFYGYHLAEHHSTPLGMAPSPSIFLAAVAQRTKTLRFGPMVFALPLYHPLRLAEEICMLDQMSNGRLELGFGRGASPIEIDIFGRDPKDSQEIYLECLDIVMMALKNGHVDFQGKYFDLQDVPVALEPIQDPLPSLWYGIHAVDSAARAGAEGLNVISLDTALETEAMLAAYKSSFNRFPSNKKNPKLGIGRFIIVGDTDHEALAIARRAYPNWHESFNYLFKYRGTRKPRHQRPAEFDAIAAQGRAVAGSIETVTEILTKELQISGANYLVGQFVFGDMSFGEAKKSVSLFADEVVPRLTGI